MGAQTGDMLIKVVSSLLACLLVCDASKVLEVSDKFLAVRKEGMWLMKFYAQIGRASCRERV